MSTNNKRKAPFTSPEDSETSPKIIKLTNHSHPERTPVLHTNLDGITKSLDIIDFATVVPDSITIVHAPDELKAKGARRRWRDEMRARALGVQAKAAKGIGVNDGGSGEEKKVANAPLDGKGPVDGRTAARTRLVRPPVKEWHASSGDYDAARGMVQMDAQAHAATPSESSDTHTARNPQEIAVTAERVSVTAPTTLVPNRLTSPPPRRALPIHKPPGLQRFDDAPLPRRNISQLDDGDESSEGESDSSEDDDGLPDKASVRGSISESFADRIFTKQTDGSGDLGELPSVAEHIEPKEDAILLQSNEIEEPVVASNKFSEAHDDDITHRKRSQDGMDDVDDTLARFTKQSDLSKRASKSKAAIVPKTPLSAPSETPTGTDHDRNKSAAQEANVVVKKSAAGGKAGGARSGNGLSLSRGGTLTEVSSNRMTTTQNLIDPAEDSEDLFEAIEDVTEEVLGDSVLSMDQCKLLHSRDSACEVDLDTLMTTDSARKVPFSQDVVVMMAHDDGSSFDDWASEDTEVSRAMHEQVSDDGPPLEAGSTTVEQSDGSVGMVLAQSPTSASSLSDLTELCRTPTPAVASRDEDDLLVVAPDSSRASNPVLPASPESTQVVVPLRRKMTGMSSKHFSPAKRPKTRLSAKAKTRTPGKGHDVVERVDTDSPLTALQTALDRIVDCTPDVVNHADGQTAYSAVDEQMAKASAAPSSKSTTKKERKAASGRKRKTVRNSGDEALVDADYENSQTSVQDNATQTPTRQTRSNVRTPAPKRKSTGKISEHFITDRVDLYNTTAGGGRIPAGTSRAPVPSINAAAMFGLIQEKIWREPFWLIIAVTFLNKTAGRSAVPVFWKLKEKYPTSEALAEADQMDLLEMVRHLGLQNQRSKRLIQIAKAWRAEPPVAGKRYRTLNYPGHGDGKASTTANVVDEDAEDCTGLLEIGNIPGCGQYAYDSWRIFCRDPLRGVADDYNGTNAKTEGFVPEWQRVLPDDKELRACLRWMWLREGWIWDPLTGEKRRATEEEMEKAVRGEMEIEDSQERKFAAQAAGVDVTAKKVKRGGNDTSLDETPAQTPAQTPSKPPTEEVTLETGRTADMNMDGGKAARHDVPRAEAPEKTWASDLEGDMAAVKTKPRKRGQPGISSQQPLHEPKLRRSSRKRAEKSK